MPVEPVTNQRPYALTVRTSRNSSTALWLDARSDADAITKALLVLSRFGTFCEKPTFEVTRWDGTIVEFGRPLPNPAAH